ncbi:YceD family protein [Psychrobacter sp. I-STPA6b]|uniref:YceD family protein n=1 Tax=Psychrobacter sp. I-STPA6b TaxID=2585718 RepID=UPI001D0C79C1|nr:YceD family protein [Psychrobacter sp. I-STPA6b]
MTSQAVAKSLPKSIVLDKWEESGFSWSGDIVPAIFPRLVELVDAEHQQVVIQLTCELVKEDNVNWLKMSFVGELWVCCQRCLQPLMIDVTYDTRLALLYDETQSSLLDEEVDYVLLDEVLVTKHHQRVLPLSDLIEDELLLNVPLSAKHDDCDMVVEQVGEIEEEEADNPFAALAVLKDELKNKG